jgi:MoaA/NifB/PqqE/SkfB family radical SAM enzyme
MSEYDSMLEEKWLINRIKGEKEQTFTSTGSKLLAHPDRLKEFRDNDNPTPIVMHIMPTDICNFQCTFCSVGNRSGYNNAKSIPGVKPDVLQMSQIKHVVDFLVSKGLKGVILSGGGEPTIFRDNEGNDFGDLIKYLRSKDLEIGLITNGSMLNKWEAEVAELTWIRVSLYPPQYNLDVVNLPDNIPDSTTLGFSWVMAYPNDANPDEISEEQILERYEKFAESIKKFAENKNGKYIRLLPDCHTYGENFIKLHNVIDKLIDNYGAPFFHQNKMHNAPEKCYLGYFHPVLYPDARIYPCDSLILNDNDSSTGKRFKTEYSMCNWNEIERVYNGTVESLIKDPKTQCPKCVFNSNNGLLNDIYKGKEVINENPSNILHKNFI